MILRKETETLTLNRLLYNSKLDPLIRMNDTPQGDGNLYIYC